MNDQLMRTSRQTPKTRCLETPSIINLLNLHTNYKRLSLYRLLNIYPVPGTPCESAVSYNGD
jgi:hypothetical protein